MSKAAEDRQKLRAVLLGQLALLIDEAGALREVIERVPPKLLEGRPLEGDLSIKETFGLMAALDEEVHQARLEKIVAEETPYFEPVEARALVEGRGWNERPVQDLLARVQTARQQLIDAFEALPAEEWLRCARFGEEERDVYEMAHHICLHDAERLRALSLRLHESHIPAPEDP